MLISNYSFKNSPLIAITWNIFWSLLFVFSLYFWKNSFSQRNQNLSIIKRFVSITTVSIIFTLVSPISWKDMGFSSIKANIFGGIVGLLMSMILYLGPLIYFYYGNELDYPKFNLKSFKDVIFAPFFEEIYFRSCMIPIMQKANFSLTSTILITPLFFGLAHLHHHIMDKSLKKTTFFLFGFSISIKTKFINALFQITYTSVFGMISSLYLIKFESFSTPFLAHVFCNFMGFPSLDFMEHPNSKSKNY